MAAERLVHSRGPPLTLTPATSPSTSFVAIVFKINAVVGHGDWKGLLFLECTVSLRAYLSN